MEDKNHYITDSDDSEEETNKTTTESTSTINQLLKGSFKTQLNNQIAKKKAKAKN